MSKPLILQLEDRKRELADATMRLQGDDLNKFNRMVGEYTGIDYVIELIKSLDKEDD
jgi:hypothetical protein